MAAIFLLIFIFMIFSWLCFGWFGFKALDAKLSETNSGIIQEIGYWFKKKSAPRYNLVEAKNPTWEQKAQETALYISENKLKGKDAQKKWDDARFDFPCESCKYQIPEGDPIPENCTIIEKDVVRYNLS